MNSQKQARPDLSIDRADTLQLTDIRLSPKARWALAKGIAQTVKDDQLWCVGRQMGKLLGLNPLPPKKRVISLLRNGTVVAATG